MNKKVIFARPNDNVKELIKVMKIKGISQMPVLYKEKICGLVSESLILNNLITNPEKINILKAEEIMEEAPPIVSKKTVLKTLLELLKDSQLVLVAEKGDVKGIISKTDILGKI